MKNVQRAVITSAMILGMAGAGSATALAQPSTGSLGGDGADIKLSQGLIAGPGGCSVEVENVGTETAEGVNVRSVGFSGYSEDLGTIEAGETVTAQFIDCALSPFPIPFIGTTTNGDANLTDNFVLVNPPSGDAEGTG
ncbi:hypothetical protein [Rhodococcus sp. NPDC058521]|uniref:hypothetical protein n=1 Tax=Rhodococcus sp. NPDC058521 TaxID=3346536 RepID=UPI00364B1B8D